MISIITPFFQSEKYLNEAIWSVLNQTYENWELLLINDGSTDRSKNIALSFEDSRIKYFEQKNKGVSLARNVGLREMKGDYFCFLDADDVLPPNSLENRLYIFTSNSEISFVDGWVKKMDATMSNIKQVWQPSFQGNPLQDLVKLTGKSFLGLTWMIKRRPKIKYKFNDSLSHGEDLLFCMELAKEGGVYDYTTEVILHYRDSPDSAMKNLEGLELGYRYIEQEIGPWQELTATEKETFKKRYRRFMFLAYLKALKFLKAFKQH